MNNFPLCSVDDTTLLCHRSFEGKTSKAVEDMIMVDAEVLSCTVG